MTEAFGGAVAPNGSFAFGDIKALPATPEERVGSRLRPLPFVQGGTSNFEPIIVQPYPSAAAVSSPAVVEHDALPDVPNQSRLRIIELMSLGISAGSLVVWLYLMLTVVARDGSLPQIIGVTAIPFLAHVASLSVAGRSRHLSQHPK